ncbi:hypothetical protein F4781DRAFT_436323 [Annulohypoxylon bovei var. microspora]|nr:hypothetical protein F4781DRAFT_436323 [Annulohypoxylon bovei var. microspora]
MRVLTLLPALALSTAVASTIEGQASPTSLKSLGESLPANDDDQSPGFRDAQGGLLKPIRKGTAVAKGLCLYSVEELQTGPVVFFSPYSLDELIAAKKRLEKEGDCQLFQNSSGINATGMRSGEIEAERNAPRCVSAILPIPNPGDAQVSPDEPDKSSAGIQGVSAVSLVVAFTALVAL